MSQMTDFFQKTHENNANSKKIPLFADTTRSGKNFMLALMERLYIMSVCSIPPELFKQEKIMSAA